MFKEEAPILEKKPSGPEGIDNAVLELISRMDKLGLNPRDVLYHLIKNLQAAGQDKVLAEAVNQAFQEKDRRKNEAQKEDLWRNMLESAENQKVGSMRGKLKTYGSAE